MEKGRVPGLIGGATRGRPVPRCRCRRRLGRTRYRPTRISGRWGPRRTRASRPATRTRRLLSSWFCLIQFGVRFIRRFVIMLGCSFRRRGECGDGLWVGYPLVVDVVAECVVRVPSPGVQRAGGCENGAVARAREDGLGRWVSTWGDATVSPCGRVTIVGVSTCQSRAHLLWETGASGRPSWPSSPQPHCGDGTEKEEVGQGWVAQGRFGI